jgi:hypothetical protein
MNSPILAPAAVLALWTMLMLGWMLITRMPAVKAAGVDMSKLIGGTGRDAERVVPAKLMWIANNYNHLMEQPTVFYAVVGILALAGAGSGFNAHIAWIYVALRIAHSLWQSLVNQVLVRFILFVMSSAVLLILAWNAVKATVGF